MRKTNVILVVIMAAMAWTLAAGLNAHAPSRIDLTWNTTEQTLKVTVFHPVLTPKSHYIDKIEVFLGDEVIAEKTFDSQQTATEMKTAIKIDTLKPGDKIKVRASCVKSGSKSEEITIPDRTGEKAVEEKTGEKEEKPGEVAAEQVKAIAGAVKPDEILAVGVMAPEFSLKNQEDKEVKLRDFRGKKNVILIFYPADNTPGCTKQMCAMRDEFADITNAETVVLGINPQDTMSHKKFIEKHSLPFPLLVDEGKKIVAAYGVKGTLATIRTVYGIDKEGRIVFARRGALSPKEVLKAFAPKEEKPAEETPAEAVKEQRQEKE